MHTRKSSQVKSALFYLKIHIKYIFLTYLCEARSILTRRVSLAPQNFGINKLIQTCLLSRPSTDTWIWNGEQLKPFSASSGRFTRKVQWIVPGDTYFRFCRNVCRVTYSPDLKNVQPIKSKWQKIKIKCSTILWFKIIWCSPFEWNFPKPEEPPII